MMHHHYTQRKKKADLRQEHISHLAVTKRQDQMTNECLWI